MIDLRKLVSKYSDNQVATEKIIETLFINGYFTTINKATDEEYVKYEDIKEAEKNLRRQNRWKIKKEKR